MNALGVVNKNDVFVIGAFMLVIILSAIVVVCVIIRKLNKRYLTLLHRVDDVYDAIGDSVIQYLENLTLGSKRTEQIVDAINQREKARADSGKKMSFKRGGNNENKKQPRKDYKYNKRNNTPPARKEQ